MAMLRISWPFYDEKQFMYLARHQTPDFARKVLRENIPGVQGSVNIAVLSSWRGHGSGSGSHQR